MLTTTEVVNRHLQSFYEKDLNGVVADYSPEAVLFILGDLLKRPAAIKPFF